MNFYPVFKKEMRSYFTSPIAYVVLFVFVGICGYFFYSDFAYYSLLSFQSGRNPYLMGTLNPSEMVIRPMFGNMSFILLLMLPMLTMRLFSEEKKSGTFELLFTYPLRDLEIIFGKFLACLTVVLIMVGLTVLYPVLVIWLTSPDIGTILTGYLGLLFLGAAFISLGLLISSLTENQVIAVILTFGAMIMLFVVGWSENYVGSFFGAILSDISITKHFQSFAKGVIDTRDIFYYLLFTMLFMYLTMKSLESKRWRG
jgi:ABC-2 type transport system permease protein